MDPVYHDAPKPRKKFPPAKPDHKYCYTCEQEKPLENFHRLKNGKATSSCYNCERERDRARSVSYQREKSNRKPRKALAQIYTCDGYKMCPACEQELSIEHFPLKRGKPLGACKECVRARDRERNKQRRPRKTPVIPQATQAGYKVCNTCLKEKPHAGFWVDNNIPDGRHGRCIQCEHNRQNNYPEDVKAQLRFRHRQSYARNIEKNRARDHKRNTTEARRAYRRARNAIKREAQKRLKQSKLPNPDEVKQSSMFKLCPQCKVEKFVGDFTHDKNRPSGHYPICKECQRRWRQSDRGKECERKRWMVRRQDPDYRKRANARKRAWNKSNPMSVRAYVLKRIALRKSATTENVDLNLILQRDGMHCYICNHEILPGHAFEFDHIIPLSRGGPHSSGNIGVSHKVCNRRKHNKLLSELTDFDRRGPD